MKIVSEFLFFRLKGIAKYLIGIFALFLITTSILSMFFLRIHKSESSFNHQKNVNLQIEKANSIVDTNRTLILSQIASLDNAINLKQSAINKLDPNNQWTVYNYSQQIDKLNNKKMTLLKELKELKGDSISVVKKETSLHNSLNRIFGVNPDSLTLIVNFCLTLIIDGSLLILLFGLSHTTRSFNSLPLKKEEAQKDVIKTFTPSKVVNLHNQTIQPRREKEQSNYATSESNSNSDLVKKLKRAVANETQQKVADDLGITRAYIYKIINGKTKNISPNVREKIEALG